MLNKKELTPMQRCRNNYFHAKYGLSDQNTWYEHQYYANGAPQPRKNNVDDDFFQKGISQEISFKRTNKAAEEARRKREEIASQRNYEFLKAVHESQLVR